MDAEKLRQLQAMNCVIPPVCGMCSNATFYQAGNVFGSCQKRSYEHGKHIGPVRPLSICCYGLCDCEHFELDYAVILQLQDFAVFVDPSLTVVQTKIDTSGA